MKTIIPGSRIFTAALLATLFAAPAFGTDEGDVLAVADMALERITAEELSDLYPEADLTVVKSTAGFSDVGRGRFEISDLLLWLFLAFLFVEGFLAWRFAHHRKTGTEVT